MLVDSLIREWKSNQNTSAEVIPNERLLRFLGAWLYAHYQPFPEKADFWERLSLWLEQVEDDGARNDDQRHMFNFLPNLLFAAEADLISMYRTAYDGPIKRWLIDSAKLELTATRLDELLQDAKRETWFGGLAGMDIATFCRVNRIHPQSYRPEFRFIAEFCNIRNVKKWLRENCYKRIVIVEDMVGTGEQFFETLDALRKLGGKSGFKILFVPFFIPKTTCDLILKTLASDRTLQHISFEPIFVMDGATLIFQSMAQTEPNSYQNFRGVVLRRGNSNFGFGETYGTLFVSYLNCPDNVPQIIHSPSSKAIFPRATREGY